MLMCLELKHMKIIRHVTSDQDKLVTINFKYKNTER